MAHTVTYSSFADSHTGQPELCDWFNLFEDRPGPKPPADPTMGAKYDCADELAGSPEPLEDLFDLPEEFAPGLAAVPQVMLSAASVHPQPQVDRGLRLHSGQLGVSHQARPTLTCPLQVTVASSIPTSSTLQHSPAQTRKQMSPGAAVVSSSARAASVMSDASTTSNNASMLSRMGMHQPKGNSESNAALYARQYRNKNKQHVRRLEDQISVLEARNMYLQRTLNEKDKQNGELKEEVKYLRSILASEGPLSSIIRSVRTTKPN